MYSVLDEADGGAVPITVAVAPDAVAPTLWLLMVAPARIAGGTVWDGCTLFQLYNEAFTPWESFMAHSV